MDQNPETKRCAGPCGRTLPIEAFPIRSENRPGRKAQRRLQCRDCHNGRRVAQGHASKRHAPPLASGPNLAAFDAEGRAEFLAECTAIYNATAGLVDPGATSKVEAVEEKITRVEEHRLKRKIKSLEDELREVTAQLSEGGEYHEVIAEVLARQNECIPIIKPRERTSTLREATPLVLASDWHVEHEVRPEQVAGRNRYNLEIAAHRMERFFEATRWGINHQREVFKIRDLIFWIGGDIIQNYLHEDDNESNLLSPTEALLFAQAEITKGIEFLLEDPELEQIVIPTNDGNHGRNTKKMRSSTRIENSLEVFLYAQLAMRFKDESRIKFILPTSQFTYLDDVYGHTIRFLHGDVFKYGGGVGGIMVPMLRAQARWETVKRASLTCLGHWHSRICLPNLMVNGSLIGYDPYAMGGGFPFEPPVQSMRMLEPLRWCSTDIPLWVSERADDDMNE